MKNRAKMLILVLGMATPILLSGCSLENVGKRVYDAAVDGVSGAVEDAVFGIVIGVLPPAGEAQ